MKIAEYGKSAIKGKLLLVLGADKYLPQILYFFVMAIVFIWINLGIEGTVHHKEQNKRIIENMRSVHTELTCRLTSLNSVCKVQEILQSMGSNVTLPDKKATRLDDNWQDKR